MLISAALSLYAEYRLGNGFARNTVTNDRQAIRRLMSITGDVELTAITPISLDDLMTHLRAERYAVTTMNSTQASLSAFFKWCRSRSHAPVDWDPIAGRRYSPVTPPRRLYVPLHDFPLVLDSATNPRDRALMALGLFTLGRQSELVSMRVSDLDLTAGVIDMHIWKSHKTDIMPLSSELADEMRRWVMAYQAECGPLNPKWFLVPAMKHQSSMPFGNFQLAPDRPISRSEDIVRRVLERAGYTDDRMGVHVLRRSAARCLFDELAKDGYDGALRLVSAMLHHASVATTERYLSLDLDRKRRDDRISGQPLFPSLDDSKVIPLRKEA